MRNLILHQIHTQNLLKEGEVLNYYLDEFSKIMVILDSFLTLHILSFQDTFNNFHLINSIPLEDLISSCEEGRQILLDLMVEDNNLNSESLINNKVKSLMYKSEDESVVLILQSGQILIIKTDSSSHKIINLTHSDLANSSQQLNFQQIICFEPSPNLEHIIVVRSDYKLALLDYEFNFKISWTDLDDGDLSSLSIGEKLESASVSWRGDSTFFSVLYSLNDKRKCLVRDLKFTIFKGPSRADGKVVFSVSEAPLPNLSNNLSWQPCGSLIAFFQEGLQSDASDNTLPMDKKAAVLFSEKNGLRHGEFYMESNIKNTSRSNSQTQISQTKQFLKCGGIKWNQDMPLLAVCTENQESKQTINFFLRSNYDWSLKYTYDLPQDVFAFKFSDSASLRLFILSKNGNFTSIEFTLEYFNLMNSSGCVGVISGNSLKLTPLGKVNIPPPMCLKKVEIARKSLICSYRDFIFILSEDQNVDEKSLSLDFIDTREKDYSLRNLTKISFRNLTKISQTIKSFIFFRKSFDQAYFIFNQTTYDQEELVYVSCQVEETANTSNNQTNDDNNYNLNFSNFSQICIEKMPHKLAGMFPSNEESILNSKEKSSHPNTELQTENLLNSKSEKDKDDLFFNLVGMTDNVNKSQTKSNSQSKNNNNIQSLLESNDLFNCVPNNNEDPEYRCIYSDNNESNYFYMITIKDNQRVFNKVTLINKNSSSFNIEELNISSNFDVIKSREINSNTNRIKNMNNEITKISNQIPKTSRNTDTGLVYLTRNNRLFFNNTLIGIDVTSFEIFKHFLLFTQSSNTPYNTLHVVHLKSLQNITSPYTPDFNSKSFSLRTVERGAVLVSISGINVTLQMPRGNLETIYPRIIVLDYIKSCILKRDYKTAFELCRKHKINTNFLYDVDPELFFSNIELFIDALGSADYLNLFLNNLDNSFCEEFVQTETDSNNLKEDFKKLFILNKVNKVCEEVRQILSGQKYDREKYITSILHSFTKKSPPEYLPALKMVQSCKKELKASSLEYLCWVVNADTLFDFALKTYDFELVIMVAKHTQKDPKEYLHYLKSLQNEEDQVKMKYRINMDLKHYADALYELSLAKEKYFPECLELIKKHNLYEKAFTLFQDEILIKKLYEVYGEHLKSSGKHLEAAWAFYRASLTNDKNENYDKEKDKELKENAMKIFIENGCVIELLSLKNILHNEGEYQAQSQVQDTSLINSSGSSNTSWFSFLGELVDICAAAKKDSQIEMIYLFTLDNQTELEKISEDHLPHNFTTIRMKIIENLVRLKKFQSAFIVLNTTLTQIKNKNSNVNLQSIFNDSLSLNANLQMNELRKNLTIYEEKYARLVKVQHLKRTQPHLFLDLQQEEVCGDTVSDSGSVISTSSKKSKGSKISNFSKKSKMTSNTKKNKTKISQRKIKEGSPIEEEFLIEVISELKLSQSDIDGIRELIKVLIWIGYIGLSDELKNLLEKYIETVPSENLLSVAQSDFLNAHPEIKELFPVLNLSSSSGKKGKFALFKTISG